VDVPAPAAAKLPNLSLSEPRLQRIFLGEKSLINFTVKLHHQGDARQATITVKANGQVLLNRAIELEKQPETILLQAQWEAEPGAWLRGEAAVDGAPDALAADNRVWFCLGPVIEGKIALLAHSSYLRVALSPEVMRGQWAMRLLDPANLVGELAQNQDADVLCLESSYLQSRDAHKLLWRYLTNGRGVILLVNRVTPSIAGSLRELGFEADGDAINSQEKFQYVFSSHPIFHPFLSVDYGNLMEVKTSKHFRLKADQALPLIFSDKGTPLFFQGTKFPGKLFVAAFGMDRDHTSWPVHQTFIPFLDLCLQASRVEDAMPATFEPGEITQTQVPLAAGVREVVLRDAEGVIDRAQVDAGKAQLHIPQNPGLYDMAYDNSTQVEKVLSVNPPPKESELTYFAGSESVQQWQMNSGTAPLRNPGSIPAASSRTGILQQRVWWWMLVGGLLALLLEMILTAYRPVSRA